MIFRASGNHETFWLAELLSGPAGESCEETAKGWKLKLELVQLGTVLGAEAAFVQSGWNRGTKL